MRKLRLGVDELQVATFATGPAADRHGTVQAHQTEPASAFESCTQTHCTYPVWLCRPHEMEPRPEPGPAKR